MLQELTFRSSYVLKLQLIIHLTYVIVSHLAHSIHELCLLDITIATELEY
jgi:hypothetical protein